MSAYSAIASAIRHIDGAVETQPELAEIAAVAGLSPLACQRLFSGMVGISPKKFLQCLTLERAKQALSAGESVLDAAYEAGLSGPGRLHDLFLALESVSPGEFKLGGLGLTIRHGRAETPFGEAIFVWCDRGLMGLGFVAEGQQADAVRLPLLGPYHAADLREDDAGAALLAGQVFTLARPTGDSRGSPLRLFVAGTPFQVQVWRALLTIPAGVMVSYEQLARLIGRPTAARAVGNAVGANPVGYLIPCHRVVRQTGIIGNYRWGAPVKRLMLGAEAYLTGAE